MGESSKLGSLKTQPLDLSIQPFHTHPTPGPSLSLSLSPSLLPLYNLIIVYPLHGGHYHSFSGTPSLTSDLKVFPQARYIITQSLSYKRKVTMTPTILTLPLFLLSVAPYNIFCPESLLSCSTISIKLQA